MSVQSQILKLREFSVCSHQWDTDTTKNYYFSNASISHDTQTLKRIDRKKLRDNSQLRELARKMRKLPESPEAALKVVMSDADIQIPMLNFKALNVLEMIAEDKVCSTDRFPFSLIYPYFLMFVILVYLREVHRHRCRWSKLFFW
jgi:hypothetical protein